MFLFISTLIIFFSSVVIPIKKTEAVGQLAVPLGVASGAGYAAVGAYVIGGLLVASGAAYVLDDEENSAKIKQHSMDVWNSFDSATKEVWKQSIDASVSAGQGILNLSDAMVTSLSNAKDTFAFNANVIAKEWEAKNSGVDLGGITITSSWITWNAQDNTDYIWFNGVISTAGFQLYRYSRTSKELTKSSGDVFYTFPIDSAFQTALDNLTTREELETLVTSYNIPIPHEILSSSSAPSIDYNNEAFDKAISTLGGVKEVALNIDNFIAKNKAGETLDYDATADALINPDGSTYTGAPTYDVPVYKVPAVPGVDAPAVPINDVYVGDTPFVNAPSTPVDTGDATDGILSGLWDWLKGILQSILDAIKAVAGAVVAGLTSLLQAIIDAINAVKEFLGTMAASIADAIGAIFLPSDGYFTNFFKDINSAWASKIPFLAQILAFLEAVRDSVVGSQLPKVEVDLPPRYGGQTMSVVDFGYFTEYRDWILNFIRFSTWFIFIKRLYARMPKVIGG